MSSGVNCPIDFGAVRSRSRPSLALLASVLVHAAIAWALASQANHAGDRGGSGNGGVDSIGAGQAPRALMVRFVNPVRDAAVPSAPAPVSASAAEQGSASPAQSAPDVTHAPEAVAALPDLAEAPVAAALPVPAAARTGTANEAAEPHYFGASAMTQAPVVADGLVGGKLLIVPGIPPQAVTLQIWVNDEGAVERVALESALPEAEEQLLLAAFAGVRFHPGRIGRIAVRGHLAMEILLDDAIRL